MKVVWNLRIADGTAMAFGNIPKCLQKRLLNSYIVHSTIHHVKYCPY